MGIIQSKSHIYQVISVLFVAIHSRNQWAELVSDSGYFSYDNFKQAASQVENTSFLKAGNNLMDRKRELAAFLANAAHETDNFTCIKENYRGPYREDHAEYPPNPNRSYYGRGPLQLSWNYNYGAFSKYYFGNKQKLLDNPDIIAEDGKLGFASAIWFWMTQPNERNCSHSVVYSQSCPYTNWGFGRTILAINKNIEGGHSASSSSLVASRIQYYRKFAKYLGVTVGTNGEQLDTVGML
ncbi:uncharacterized protein DEA37_0004680 [Paragonimus westermani]|uniref:Glycoside hydrolase family 19 catalytic domain-containing protein n=1 Tax=Paragonimus westermani TaxID=34504 RepID=A0A5J4NR13_9TREM|nr:uncharacterized protein DEA37_0004680 [Paragonimus westermani]